MHFIDHSPPVSLERRRSQRRSPVPLLAGDMFGKKGLSFSVDVCVFLLTLRRLADILLDNVEPREYQFTCLKNTNMVSLHPVHHYCEPVGSRSVA